MAAICCRCLLGLPARNVLDSSMYLTHVGKSLLPDWSHNVLLLRKPTVFKFNRQSCTAGPVQPALPSPVRVHVCTCVYVCVLGVPVLIHRAGTPASVWSSCCHSLHMMNCLCAPFTLLCQSYNSSTFIFPFHLRGKPTPLLIMLMAFAFCLVNG